MHERGLGLTAARIAEDQDLRAMLQVLEQVELDRAVRLDRGGDEAGAGKRQRIDDDVEREDDRQQREERAEEPGEFTRAPKMLGQVGLGDREDAPAAELGVVVERVFVRVSALPAEGDPQGCRLAGGEQRRRASLDMEVVAFRGGVCHLEDHDASPRGLRAQDVAGVVR
jgi:hypothetical protein